MIRLSGRVRRPVIVIAVCLALAAGLVYGRFVPLHSIVWIWLLVPFAVLSLRMHNVYTVILLVLLAAGIGWWRGGAYAQKLAEHQATHFRTVSIVGRATDEATYGKRSQLEFVLSDIQQITPDRRPLIGTMTIRGFGEPMVYRGDVVRVTGKVYPTLGNSLASISFADISVVQRDESRLNNLRRQFAAGMQSALPEPLASFALGLLIGQRTTLPEQTEAHLRQVGLTHIIAVSGYNLTVIVMACRRLFAPRSKFQAAAACVLLVTLFLLITGFSPPVVRASVICMLGLSAWYYGRDIKPLVLLLVGAAITVVANPLYLWGNVSWYLSFLAFYGVLVLAPLITKRLFGGREPRLLVSVLIESACATVMVLPYVLYIFGETSIVGLPANLLVVPFIPLAMIGGLIAGLAGMLAPAIAGWFAWPARLLLTYMLDVANILSRLPHAFVERIEFSLPAMLASYAALAFIAYILWRKTKYIRKVVEP